MDRREWMGVEPTAACSAQPATNFEDWGAHRDTTTPTNKFSAVALVGVLVDIFRTFSPLTQIDKNRMVRVITLQSGTDESP